MKLMNKIKRVIKSLITIAKEEKIVAIPSPVNNDAVLHGKVALITGGNSGIGLKIAEAFIRSGCKVIIAGTNEKKLKDACTNLERINCYHAKSIKLDVRKIEELRGDILKAASLYEENRIDILVNSAGVGQQSPFGTITEEEWDLVMDINAKGTFFMCQEMGNYMKERGIKGHILNIASSSSLRPACAPYLISKWGVRGMTMGIADELIKYGIVVNAVAPGPVATPMLGKQEEDNIYSATNPSGRIALPTEIAALATFMVSDYGNLIVGDTYFMTGGSGVISLHR